MNLLHIRQYLTITSAWRSLTLGTDRQMDEPTFRYNNFSQTNNEMITCAWHSLWYDKFSVVLESHLAKVTKDMLWGWDRGGDMICGRPVVGPCRDDWCAPEIAEIPSSGSTRYTRWANRKHAVMRIVPRLIRNRGMRRLWFTAEPQIAAEDVQDEDRHWLSLISFNGTGLMLTEQCGTAHNLCNVHVLLCIVGGRLICLGLSVEVGALKVKTVWKSSTVESYG